LFDEENGRPARYHARRSRDRHGQQDGHPFYSQRDGPVHELPSKRRRPRGARLQIVNTWKTSSISLIVLYEVLMAFWIFGALLHDSNNYVILTGVMVLHYLVGFSIGRRWALLATLPPVIASAPLPSPPDSDFTVLWLMLVL